MNCRVLAQHSVVQFHVSGRRWLEGIANPVHKYDILLWGDSSLPLVYCKLKTQIKHGGHVFILFVFLNTVLEADMNQLPLLPITN